MSSPAFHQPTQPVYDAVCARNAERVRVLLDTGADPDAAPPPDGETPLLRAIDGALGPDDRWELVSVLLEHGADPTRLDANGTGPLFLALLYEDIQVLELLLHHGADPNGEVGFADKSLLWWARSDYIYETYGRTLPEEPDAETWQNIDALIHFLDVLAHRQRKPRPEALRLLRLYGARI